MNRKQRVALATGVALVILTGLFPPYEGVGAWRSIPHMATPPLRVRMGHHFLFAPPSRASVGRAIRNLKPPTRVFTADCRASLVLPEVMLQLVVIVLATTGVVLLLGQRKA